MFQQSEFTLASVTPTLQLTGFFADFYNVNPNQISSVSQQSFSAQNSRIYQFSNNQLIYELMFQKLSIVVQRSIKRNALYQINNFQAASESQIMIMATGLVKLRYLVEKKLRITYQKGLIKINDHGKDRIKTSKKAERILECFKGIDLKYFRMDMIRYGFESIQKYAYNISPKNKCNLDLKKEDISEACQKLYQHKNKLVRSSIDKLKSYCKQKQKLQIFVDTLSHQIKNQIIKTMKQAFHTFQQMESKEKCRNNSVIKRISIENNIQHSKQLQQNGKSEEHSSLPSTTISFAPTAYDSQESKQTKTSTQCNSQTENRKLIIDFSITEQQAVNKQSQHGVIPLQSVHSEIVNDSNNGETIECSKLSQQNIKNQRSRISSQNSIKSFIKPTSINDLQCKQVSRQYQISISDSKEPTKIKYTQPSIQSPKRPSIFNLNNQISMFKKNQLSSVVSTQFNSPKNQKSSKLTQIQLRQNQIKVQPSQFQNIQTQINHQIDSQQKHQTNDKQEQQKKYLISQPLQFQKFMARSFVEANVLDQPFESFFFAKNHRSSNLYHRHPDLAYQQLGDLTDTPQIFHLQTTSPSITKYSYEFKKPPARPNSNCNGNNCRSRKYETYQNKTSNVDQNSRLNDNYNYYTSPDKYQQSNYDSNSYFTTTNKPKSKLTSVRSADNLLNFDKLQKSIYIHENAISPSVLPTTPTNDKYRNSKFSEQMNINQQKFDAQATSSRSSKYKQYSTGSQAFEQYLKQKSVEKRGSDLFYSKVGSMVTPVSLIQSPKTIQNKPFIGSQVYDYFPLATKAKVEQVYSPKTLLPPIRLNSNVFDFNLSTNNRRQ